MKSPTRLYLIRHGEVEAKYQKVFGGRIDMDLSPFGREQAEAMADYLQRVPFDAIYASPMRRVQQTLAKLAETQNKKPVIIDGLREVDFGSWTGLGWDQVSQQFNVSAFRWLDQLSQGLIHEAENIDSFRSRVEQSLGTIMANAGGQTVAVVCHGGVIRMLLSLLLDLPLPKMARFDIEYASITVVSHLPDKTETQLLNFTPWRDQN